MVALYCLFVLLWAVVFGLLGIPGTPHFLGGVAVLFYLLPLFPLLQFKRKYRLFSNFIWAVVLGVSSIILINYLSVWLASHKYNNLDGVVLNTYVLIVPLMLIALPYGYLIEACLNMRRPGNGLIYEVPWRLRPVAGFTAVAFIVPIAVFFPLIVNPYGISDNEYASGYQFGLLAIGLGSVWLFSYVRDIDSKTISYLSCHLKDALAYNPRDTLKIIAGAIGLVLWSAMEEFLYRGQWILLIVSIAVLVPLFLIVSRIAKILMVLKTDETAAPREVMFPSWRKGKHFTILIMFVITGLICWVLR
jgi:hypothetical protein